MKKLLFLPLLFFALKCHAATTTDFIQYGATTAIVCPGFNGLTASASVGISCTRIANTGSPSALDAYVTVIATNSSGAPAAPYAVQVYVYGSADDVNYEMDLSSNPAGGGAYTIASTGSSNLRPARIINLDTAAKSSIGGFFVAPLFGGILPKYWGLVIINNTGQTLGASNNNVYYQNVNIQNQ